MDMLVTRSSPARSRCCWQRKRHSATSARHVRATVTSMFGIVPVPVLGTSLFVLGAGVRASAKSDARLQRPAHRQVPEQPHHLELDLPAEADDPVLREGEAFGVLADMLWPNASSAGIVSPLERSG